MSHGECLEVPLLKARGLGFSRVVLKKHPTSNQSLQGESNSFLEFMENLCPPDAPISLLAGLHSP